MIGHHSLIQLGILLLDIAEDYIMVSGFGSDNYLFLNMDFFIFWAAAVRLMG